MNKLGAKARKVKGRGYKLMFDFHNRIPSAIKRNWTRFHFPKGGNFEVQYPCIEYTTEGKKVCMEEDGKMRYLSEN